MKAPLALGLALQAAGTSAAGPTGQPQRLAVPYEDLFRSTCGPRFVDRVAQSYVESRWNPRAVSPVGAEGLFQAMPPTWRWYQDLGWVSRVSRPSEPGPAIVGGHRHMLYLESLFRGDQEAAWASFNWGQGNVLRVIRSKSHAAQIGLAQPRAWVQFMPKETSDYLIRIPSSRARLVAQGVR